MGGLEALFDRAATVVPLLSFPLLLVAIFAWGRVTFLRRVVAADGFTRTALVVGTVSLLLYLGQIIVYLFYPGFVDHVQTTIAVMSYMAVHGRDLYPSPDGAGIYGMPYGPILFLVDGLGLRLDPSILASKLPGLAALLGTLAAMWKLLRWKLRDRSAAYLAVATLVVLLLPYGLFAYWNRPESFLLLCAALALSALRLPRVQAELVVGLMLGLAAGLKLHGFVFAAPAALALIGRGASLRQKAESLLLQTVAAAVVLLAPFALSNVSLANYGHYLSMAAGHGLDIEMLGTSLALAAAFAGPPALLYAWRRPSLAAQDRWLLFGFLAAMAVAALVAGRVQAGPYHILPMIPVALYATAVVAGPALVGRPLPLAQRNFWAAGLMLAILAGGTGFLRNYGGLSVVEYLENRPAMTDAMAELGDLAERYPAAQMAVSDDDHYWLAMQDAVLVMRSGRIAIDYATWMDLVLVGADSGRLMQFIDRCQVPVWIMPTAGTPFSLSSIYTHGPLFSDEFRRRFLANYVEVETGRFYRVWNCRTG
jgi:hypothetical protein